MNRELAKQIESELKQLRSVRVALVNEREIIKELISRESTPLYNSLNQLRKEIDKVEGKIESLESTAEYNDIVIIYAD